MSTMKLRVNIAFSIMAHAVIITMAFALVGRGWISPAPANPLTVSLVSGTNEIKALDAQDQEKQASHNPGLSTRDIAVSSPPEHHASTVRDKTSSEAGRDASQITSSAGESKVEEKSPKEPVGAIVELSGSQNARSVPSSSLSADYQKLPAGIGTSGSLGPNQAKTHSKGAHTEEGKAIRKAIERALVYPLFARKRRWEGTAVTEFAVNAKGYPEDIRVIGSSGYDILDTAAKEALVKAAPFTVEKSRYEIPITFRLKNN